MIKTYEVGGLTPILFNISGGPEYMAVSVFLKYFR